MAKVTISEKVWERRWKPFYPVLLIAMILALFLPKVTQAMPLINYEGYTTGGDSWIAVPNSGQSNQLAQTFTATSAHTVSAVSIWVRTNVGLSANCVVGIKQLERFYYPDGSFFTYPSGPFLTYGTLSMQTVTTHANGGWYSVPMIHDYPLIAGKEYAIVLYAPQTGGNVDYFFWRADSSSPAYDGGYGLYSPGDYWSVLEPEADFMFHLQGHPIANPNDIAVAAALSNYVAGNQSTHYTVYARLGTDWEPSDKLQVYFQHPDATENFTIVSFEYANTDTAGAYASLTGFARLEGTGRILLIENTGSTTLPAGTTIKLNLQGIKNSHRWDSSPAHNEGIYTLSLVTRGAEGIIKDSGSFIFAPYADSSWTPSPELLLDTPGNGYIEARNPYTGATVTPGSCDSGTIVELAAVPEGGYHLKHWQERFHEWWNYSRSAGKQPAKTVFIVNKTTATAIFEPNVVSFNVSKVGDGIVSKSPDHPTYTGNTSVRFTATATPGWRFDHWQYEVNNGFGNIPYTSSANPMELNINTGLPGDANSEGTIVNGGVNVKGVFIQPETYRVNLGYGGYGSVSADPGFESAPGTPVSLTAVPVAGKTTFSHWASDDMVISEPTVNPLTFEMPARDIVVRAHFTSEEFTLTTISDPPEGGSVSPASGMYPYRTFVELTATPNPGWYFTGWSGIDVYWDSVDGNLARIDMRDNKTVTALFARSPYRANYDANGGAGTAAGHDNLREGDTFTAVTNPFIPPFGTQFREWNTSPDGSGTGYAPGATVTMPAHDLILYAIWEPSLFLSEYIDGSGSNKALEIYNPSDIAIDLAVGNYKIELYFNAYSNDPGTTINLTGTIPPGGVYVLARDGADQAILDRADQTTSLQMFNGNDTIILRRGTEILDVFGQRNYTPVNGWQSGDIRTWNTVLRRLPTVIQGDRYPFDPFDPALEWEQFNANDFSGLGEHQVIGPPTISINDVSGFEGDSGTTDFTFIVSLSSPADSGGVIFDIGTADGTATAPEDYIAKSRTGQMIPAGTSSYTFTVQVIGDTLYEPDETFYVNLTSVAGAIVDKAQGVGTILNDDLLQYTVSFDSQGGSSVESQTVNDGGLVTKPDDPTKEGYTFAGWFTDIAYNAQWNFSTDTVAADVTLFAKWTETTTPVYTLTVATDPAGIDSTTGSGEYESGETVEISAPESVEFAAGSRHLFTGWSGEGVTFADPLSPATTLIMPAGDVTVTANYVTQYYLMVDNSGHGEVEGEGWFNAGTSAQAAVMSLTVNEDEMNRYAFAGWSGDAAGSGSPSNDILMDGPKTATATWVAQYRVTFAQSGIGTHSSNWNTDAILTVNGVTKTAAELPFTTDWLNSGTSLSYAYTSLVTIYRDSEASGRVYFGARYNWISTAGLSQTQKNGTFVVNAAGTVTAGYDAEYRFDFGLIDDYMIPDCTATEILTVSINGIDKTGSDLPFSVWAKAGDELSYEFTDVLYGASGTKYVWRINNTRGGLGNFNRKNTLIVEQPGSAYSLYCGSLVTVSPTAQQYGDEVTFDFTIGWHSIDTQTVTDVHFYIGEQNMGGTTLNMAENSVIYSASLTVPLLETVSGQLAAGNKVVTAKLGNQDSVFNPTTTLTINPRNVAVTAIAGQSKVYGNADPTLTYQVTSGSLADGDSFTGALSRAAGEDVGTYAINLGTLTAGPNYTINFVPSDFTVTPKNASVTPAPAGKTYGDADPTFTGTLTGFLAADGVSAVYSRTSGETVAGSPYTISASLSPSGVLGNYNITYNTADFTINPKGVTVTATAGQSKVYGEADPIFTYTTDPLVGSDAYSGALARTTGKNVGTYAINLGTLTAGPNYTINFTAADFTITPKDASVTPAPAGKTYGDADPTLTGTLTGFLPADGVSAVYSRTPGETVAGSPYTISAALSPSGVLGNYSITYNTADFTINKVSLTVTAENKTSQYSDPRLQLTYNIHGLVNGETLGTGGVTGVPSLNVALSNPVTQAPGNYPIEISTGTLNAGNYSFTFVGGTYTITKEDADLSFPAANPVAVRVASDGGKNSAFTWQAKITQANDGYPGDLNLIKLADITLSFSAVGSGGGWSGKATAFDHTTGIATFNVPADVLGVETYTGMVTLNNSWFAATPEEDVLVIYDPSLGFTTGGGWFYWPAGTAHPELDCVKVNFGYTMKYNKKGQNIQGSFLLIAHLSDGGIIRLKSNAINGFAIINNTYPGIASFSGKCVYSRVDADGNILAQSGNQEFTVYVQDMNEPGNGTDMFWFTTTLTIAGESPFSLDRNRDNKVDQDEYVLIGGGNIVVPHTAGSSSDKNADTGGGKKK